MGVPSVLPLPAAASDRAGGPSRRPWGHMLLWTALLVLGPPKAVVRLEPPWFNVLREDDVTLHCQGPHGPADGPTQWSRDGTPILAQVQPRFSFKASLSDSGDYRCQTGQTGLSDPVHLNVTSDWLLLQTPSLLLQEGDHLLLRCHSWQNRPLFKIQFLQDGVSRRYSPANSSFFVPHANVSHSGTYHCSGFIGRMKHESNPVNITVQGRRDDSSFPVTIVVAVVVVIAVVAAVAAVAAWVCLRQSQSAVISSGQEAMHGSAVQGCWEEDQASGLPAAATAQTQHCHHAGGAPESREVGETPPEEPATLTQAEEAAKTEAENSITYSLLMHPEEDPGLSDYQNM
ncbi:low affinity immunoglobulin gamma Fc region receptor II-b isoform X2 [Phyllostomus hastatus]|uniref:low affinity immunoglobulin gamma Fc region receptor II-b isoform X2 n=1 Tax=Phyllostomus hastatus TaxID=9423 RepID=UPI001E680B85|nr:low affinity immunoglobulin gamma Fc region receptor II-b isoform X2 [Phyllostomus hastatus]